METQLKTVSKANLTITKEMSFCCPECKEEIILNTDTTLSSIAGLDIEDVLRAMKNAGFYKFVCPECEQEIIVMASSIERGEI